MLIASGTYLWLLGQASCPIQMAQSDVRNVHVKKQE